MKNLFLIFTLALSLASFQAFAKGWGVVGSKIQELRKPVPKPWVGSKVKAGASRVGKGRWGKKWSWCRFIRWWRRSKSRSSTGSSSSSTCGCSANGICNVTETLFQYEGGMPPFFFAFFQIVIAYKTKLSYL